MVLIKRPPPGISLYLFFKAINKMDCVLCNDKDTSKSLVANVLLDSYEIVLSRLQERDKYKDGPVLNFVERAAAK